MRRLKFTLFALASLLLCSCSAYKKVPYLQGSEYLNMANVQTPLYDAHIMPKDLLCVTMYTPRNTKAMAIPFSKLNTPNPKMMATVEATMGCM